MKTIFSKLRAGLIVVATLAMSNPVAVPLVVGGAAIAATGCAGKGTYNPATHVYDPQAKADQVVVTAEKVEEVARGVFDRFMKAERENEAPWRQQLGPTPHKIADDIRANGEKWIMDLDAAKVAYQSNRTESNKVTVNQLIATVQAAIAQAQSFIGK